MKCILGKKLLESFSLETELLLRKVCHGHVTDSVIYFILGLLRLRKLRLKQLSQVCIEIEVYFLAIS